MTDRVFQDHRCFEVSTEESSVEAFMLEDNDMMILVKEDWDGWDCRSASFRLTAEEATMLKEFLISKGY